MNVERVDGVSLWITNDTLEEFRDTVTVFLGDFSGHRLYEETLEVQIPPNASRPVKHFPDDSRPEVLAIRSHSGSFFDNRHCFVEIKDLDLPKPELRVEIAESSDATWQVTVATHIHAYFVKLIVSIDGTRFSGNYFDLFAGQERVIEIWSEEDRRLEEDDIAVSCFWQGQR